MTVPALHNSPPLVIPQEVTSLAHDLLRAEAGDAFVLHVTDRSLQAGELTEVKIVRAVSLFLSMVGSLLYRGGVATVKVMSVDQGAEGEASDEGADRRAYEREVVLANALRGLTRGGFGDLRNFGNWAGRFEWPPEIAAYNGELAKRLVTAVAFAEAIGLPTHKARQLGVADLYLSKRMSSVDFEESFTHGLMDRPEKYGLTAHVLGISARRHGVGDRSVDYLRRVGNPVSIRLEPPVRVDGFVRLVDALTRSHARGRAVVTVPLVEGWETDVRSLLDVCRREELGTVWICEPDPRGGDALDQTRAFREICDREGAVHAGTHLRVSSTEPSASDAFSATEAMAFAIGLAREMRRSDTARPEVR